MLNDAIISYLDSSEREDIMNISYGGQYDFVSYENLRSAVVLKSIWRAFDVYATYQQQMKQAQVNCFQQLKPLLETLRDFIICLKNQLKDEADTISL